MVRARIAKTEKTRKSQQKWNRFIIRRNYFSRISGRREARRVFAVARSSSPATRVQRDLGRTSPVSNNIPHQLFQTTTRTRIAVRPPPPPPPPPLRQPFEAPTRRATGPRPIIAPLTTTSRRCGRLSPPPPPPRRGTPGSPWRPRRRNHGR